jgi:hypothetical protein
MPTPPVALARRHHFRFADEHAVTRWNRLFGVDVRRASVMVGPERFEARFGPWYVATPLANVADAELTGPYRRWKVAGPAHVSVADRGLTFASTTARGVCVRFHEPVPGALAIRRLRHPALTVTVEDPASLVDLLETVLRPQAGTA